MKRADTLGDRFKQFERMETERVLYTGLPTIVRIDGRAFHTFTKKFNRPFDQDFCKAMDDTTKVLVDETNALVGYTQSDEISLVIAPVRGDAQPYFGGRVFKITSVLASLATITFNNEIWKYKDLGNRAIRNLPIFDARVFNVMTDDVVDYLKWREIDAFKNFVSMVAQHHIGHKHLDKVNTKQKQEVLFNDHGININDFAPRYRRGGYFVRREVNKELDAETLARIPEKYRPTGPILRHEVQELDMPYRLTQIWNKEGVLFYGEKPILTTDTTVEEEENES